MQAGTICFVLYFVAEAVDGVGWWSDGTAYAMIIGVFVAAPIPGTAVGGHLTAALGGYFDRLPALTLISRWMAGGLLASALLPAAVALDSRWLYVAGFYAMLFCGAVPTAGINGVCVAMLPGAAHAGSGVQFALQNSGKIVLPILGGLVIDRAGVVAGFGGVVVVGCVLMTAPAFLAVRFEKAARARRAAPFASSGK